MEQKRKVGRPRKDPMIAAVEAPKKRGRPAGTRTKHRVTVQSVKQNWEEQYRLLWAEFKRLEDVCKSCIDGQRNAVEKFEDASFKVRNLEHQAIGYRSVISYLESKIEQLITNSVRGD